MNKSPAKKGWPADKVERRPRGTRVRRCSDCGIEEYVRSDNKAEICMRCSGKKSGAKGVAAIKARAEARMKPCEVCGEKHSNIRFCSRACRSANTGRVGRECKYCGSKFSVLASVLKTNASGNFCSRPCYESFLCRTERTTGRGSQWKRSRDEAIRRAPFCALCGTTKALQVHHIIPFRISHDNSQRNLVPLCVKHHRIVESALIETEEFGFGAVEKEAWFGIVREAQMATAAKIKEVVNA